MTQRTFEQNAEDQRLIERYNALHVAYKDLTEECEIFMPVEVAGISIRSQRYVDAIQSLVVNMVEKDMDDLGLQLEERGYVVYPDTKNVKRVEYL